MQNKGAIKFFAIAFALVCLFQLSFTYFTTSIEKDARKYAHSNAVMQLSKKLANGHLAKEKYLADSISAKWYEKYLDSIKHEEVYNFLWLKNYTYNECKDREINLGLDLKGGMNVTLEVKVYEIVKALSGNSEDPVFNQALKAAREKQKNSQADFVTLFAKSFEEIDPNAKLASIFTRVDLKDRIKYNSTNEEVLAVIREETDGAIDRAFNILNTRINRFGVSQPNIQRVSGTGRILIDLPGVKDPERVRNLLKGTAKLEFWETWEYSEVANYLAEANKALRDEVADEMAESSTKDQTAKKTKNKEEDASSLLEQIEKDTTNVQNQQNSLKEYAKENPLYAILRPAITKNNAGQYVPRRGAIVGSALIKDTATVNDLLKRVKDVFPKTVRLAWANKPESWAPEYLDLIALKINTRDGQAPLSGEAITDARQDFDRAKGSPEVTLRMNKEGARIWSKMTGENIDRQLAIVLDGLVYSHPNVITKIDGGSTSISGGNMQLEEAKDLANILKAGKLPAPTSIVEEAVVGPSLGKEAIQEGLWSFVIAFILVLLYMAVYYNHAGIIANLALVTNIFFLFGVLASLSAVLTLPGIAGIVLTLGMAVDANVIIYERIKEEVRAGKGIQLAIADGYKNAYSAIIDGNVTTLLTGIVLYIFGSGPVQGFATTLIIGILSSLFSAIFISRLIFNYLLKKNFEVKFANNLTKNVLSNTNFDFLKIRKITYAISAAIILVGIISLFTNGLNYGVDFSGGRNYIVRFDNNVQTNNIREALTVEFDNMAPEVKTFGPSSQVKITTKYKIDDDGDHIDSEIQQKLYNGLKSFYKDKSISYNTFSTDASNENKLVGILSSSKVGPTIADDIRNKSAMAVIFALIAIFIYIAARFKKWQYGLAGVIALFHDSFITISLFSLFYAIMPFNMEIDQAFIAAILTIIGYSINDTVIIFDRIREYIGLFPKKEIKDNMNHALNSTLARTINTSGTTIVVLLTIFIFGGEIIRGFTFALLVGVVVGTYSSLFTASPIAYDLIGKKQSDASKAKTLNKKKK